MSHETIYLSFFIQGRGALRRQLAQSLRTGRAYRRPKTIRDPTGTFPAGSLRGGDGSPVSVPPRSGTRRPGSAVDEQSETSEEGDADSLFDHREESRLLELPEGSGNPKAPKPTTDPATGPATPTSPIHHHPFSAETTTGVARSVRASSAPRSPTTWRPQNPNP